MTREDLIDYWLASANKDYKAMNSLFKNGHYVWTLFLGYLVLEKLLKAIYAKQVGANFPYTHDLAQIALKSKLKLTEEQKNLLDEVTTFNIKARYPDFKGRFYKKATKSFTETYIAGIKDLRKWLLKIIRK